MRRRARGSGIALAAGVLLALAALAAGTASAWHPPTTEAEAQRRATADARRRAALFALPAAAHAVTRLPAHLRLGKPPVPASNRWVDIASRWRFDWPMPKVVAYLRTHAPPGAEVEDEGAQVYRGKTIEHGLELSWDQNGWQAESRYAYLRVVPDGSGAALRIDTVASWKHPDLSADIIPATAFLKIELTKNRPEKTRQVAEITDPTTISTVAGEINELPFFGPRTKICPETDTGELRMSFRAEPKGKQIADLRLELPACGYSIETEVENNFSHDRTEGQRLLEAVEPLLPASEPRGRD